MSDDISISGWTAARFSKAAQAHMDRIDDQIAGTFGQGARERYLFLKKEVQAVKGCCDNFPPSTPLQQVLDTLKADADQLEAMRSNLIRNQRKFYPFCDEMVSSTLKRLATYENDCRSFPDKIFQIIRWDRLEHTITVSAAEIRPALAKPETSFWSVTRWAQAALRFISSGRLFNKSDQ